MAKIISSPEHLEEELEETAAVFKSLADPARLRILNLLAANGWTCNCEIEAATGYGNSKISRHLAYLKQAGLIRSKREGTWIFYSLKQANDPITMTIHRILEQLPERITLLSHDRKSFRDKVKQITPPINLEAL